MFNDAGATSDLAGKSIKSPVAVVVNSPRRLSISEPINGYLDYPGGQNAYNPPLDNPLDQATTVPTDITQEIKDAIVNVNGRTNSVAVVHLQRLANPLMPYNGVTNPYRTIDSMPIDLMAFNGLQQTTDDPQASPPRNVATGFWARERGANTTPANHVLWTQEPLVHNDSYPPLINGSAPTTLTGTYNFMAPLSHTLGYLNSTFGTPGDGTAAGIGDPSSAPAFPWLTWNNRPFVSQLESALVPWAKTSQLCFNFEHADNTNSGKTIIAASTGSSGGSGGSSGQRRFRRVWDLR